MFAALSTQPADPLLALIGLFQADPRPGKIDLGVGVYRDGEGRTPVFRAVKQAERVLWETQDTKSYVGPEGDGAFLERLWRLAGGGAKVPVAGVQTPGGSGALRLAAELVRAAGSKRIWLGLPSWPNHAGIFNATGLPIETYRFFDRTSQALLFDEMMGALNRAEAGDVVLLHACCHAELLRMAPDVRSLIYGIILLVSVLFMPRGMAAWFGRPTVAGAGVGK